MTMQLQMRCCCITGGTIETDCVDACTGNVGSTVTVAFPAFNAAPVGGACCTGLDTTYELPWAGDTDPTTGSCFWFLSFPHPCIASVPLHADSVIEVSLALGKALGDTLVTASIVERWDLNTGIPVPLQRYGHNWLSNLGASPVDCYGLIQALSIAYSGVDAGATFPYCLDGYDPFGPPADVVATMNP